MTWTTQFSACFNAMYKIALRHGHSKVLSDKHCAYNVTLRRVHATVVVVGEQYTLHILSVCLQPLVPSVKCACAILSSMACPALQYYLCTLCLKRHYFGKKKKLLHTKCVLVFSTIFVRVISHSKKK